MYYIYELESVTLGIIAKSVDEACETLQAYGVSCREGKLVCVTTLNAASTILDTSDVLTDIEATFKRFNDWEVNAIIDGAIYEGCILQWLGDCINVWYEGVLVGSIEEYHTAAFVQSGDYIACFVRDDNKVVLSLVQSPIDL